MIMWNSPEAGGKLLERAFETLRSIREGLESAPPWSPDQCGSALAEALHLMESLPDALAPAGPPELQAAREEATRLRLELKRVRALLDSAASFYEGWSRWRGGLVAGYTARGTPAETPPRSRVLLAG